MPLVIEDEAIANKGKLVPFSEALIAHLFILSIPSVHSVTTRRKAIFRLGR